MRREARPLWQAREPNLGRPRESYQERLREYRDSRLRLPCSSADPRGVGLSSACLLELALVCFDLNQRIVGMHWLCGFVEEGQCIGVWVISGKGSLYRGEKAAKTAER